MPKRPQKGKKAILLELEPNLIERIRLLARKNGRPLREEVTHALERHLASPPAVKVTIDTPELGSIDTPELGSVEV